MGGVESPLPLAGGVGGGRVALLDAIGNMPSPSPSREWEGK